MTLSDGEHRLRIDLEDLSMEIQEASGKVKVPSDHETGLSFNGRPVISSEVVKSTSKEAVLKVVFSNGDSALVDIKLEEGVLAISVDPKNDQLNKISVRFGGMPVAYGLGDAGGWNKTFNLVGDEEKTFRLINDGGGNRWGSSFAIFPKNGFAGAFFSQGNKSVTLSKDAYHVNIKAKGVPTFYFFVGGIREIYQQYQTILEAEGFEAAKPKFTLFELGWESWDALGWNTNQETVKAILEKFLREGYPIKWAVTGSGFWDKGGTTTSFGRWGEKFTEPERLKEWMHANEIHWMIGLRTNFIPEGGPYFPQTTKRDKNLKVASFYGNDLSRIGVRKGYFVNTEEGNPLQLTSTIFPIVPSYLLDGRNKKAAQWYADQYEKWEVDGIKEDTMMDLDSLTGIFNRPIKNISDGGGLVMARNGEFVSTGTLLRINDTSVGEKKSRIPINYFQYAVSGFPNVYSDVAGVHNMHHLSQVEANIQHAWLLALTAGMAVGAYPENWPEEQRKAFKKAVDVHYQLAPYLYSAALMSYHSGYPYTLSPMPLAFPQDPEVYRMENFQWMIGESVLAAPKLSDDKEPEYSIYLPGGIWYEFESGKKHIGPVHLDKYQYDRNKVPLFIGGKGIIVLRKNDEEHIAQVYPTSKEPVSYKHHYNDSGEVSEIKVVKEGLTKPRVLETNNGKEINYQYKDTNGMLAFPVRPGIDYQIIF
ncbi:TIM-barrel domain-containing protein [Echinicola sediminis]